MQRFKCRRSPWISPLQCPPIDDVWLEDKRALSKTAWLCWWRESSRLFLGHFDFWRESFPNKWLSNFICKDLSLSLSLKNHQCVPDCWIRLLYLIDNLAFCLKKFSDILHNVVIIDRSFVKMELLKPIFAAIALLGLHITPPLNCLLVSKDTTYSDLLYSFSQLYKDLTEIYKIFKIISSSESNLKTHLT